MFKKIIISIIFLPFLIVPLFCCCIRQAGAATVGEEHCQDEQGSHAAKHDQSKHHSHSCDCAHSFNISLENVTTIQAGLTSGQNFFVPETTVQPFSFASLKGFMHLAYLGPPGRASEVPLYIQQHSLRI